MHPSKPTSSGRLLRRHSECHSYEPGFTKQQMPKSAGEKNRVSSWNLGVLWVLIGAAVAVHLLAVFAVFPLFKDGVSGGNYGEFPPPASSFAGSEERLKEAMPSMGAREVEDISVCATSGSLPTSMDSVINLDHGDPTMYEKFWREAGSAAELVIPGSHRLSYFSDVSNLCWFLEPALAAEVRRLHRIVGNAIAGPDSYLIVGTGSSQLFQAALFALSTNPHSSGHGDSRRPLPVVSSVPYYSSYPAATGLLLSGLFRWAGDPSSLKEHSEPYIEVVCSPGNPDGLVKTALINSIHGKEIHDLAYYWPQYTAITHAADHNIMLFSISKCTGHAGMRLGWAFVKDRDVATRMMKFIEISTIGVSKDSQLRAAMVLKAVSDQYELEAAEDFTKLFHFGKKALRDRWQRLREAVATSDVFSLPEFKPEYCNFMKEITLPFPAFAWMKCEGDIDDCEEFLRRNHKILTRSGKHFGADMKHVRINMLDRAETFDMFIDRLSSIKL